MNLSEPPRVIREDIEWSLILIPGIHATDRPHILLLGDSITNAYFPHVEKAMEGKGYVAKLATSKSLGDPAFLEEVALVLKQCRFDVIHFNNGMHGVGYTEEEYRRDLPALIALFRQYSPGAALIGVTTTAKRVSGSPDRFDPFNERIKVRNALLRTFLTAEKIPLNDLYALTENSPDLYTADGTHFNGQGSEIQGKQVTERVQNALAERNLRK
ncbi:MAG: SGNH/GDSL hydrolase family protein [Capsulimonadales bacterium]|nr:SGNH/GDSL hydrolase family protein [Capsulimonadales bacterium]